MSSAADKRWFQAVAELQTCALCGAHGVQVAHRNEGKGMGRKVSACWTAALCPSCHVEIDSGKDLEREERRRRMDQAVLHTIKRLFDDGRLVIR